MRRDRDTIIVPVVEEVITIERKLVLKEEIHIRRARKTEQYRETVMLRAQEAVIDRIEADANAPGADVHPAETRAMHNEES